MRVIAAARPAFDPPPARRIGLISLVSDPVASGEIRSVLADPNLAIYETRIPNEDRISPESLAAMGPRLTEAAACLPPGPYESVAYLCTSAAMILGPETVAARVEAACPGARVTDPMTAALACCRARGIGRIGLVTPYVTAVTEGIAQAFEAGGVAVSATASFFVESDARVARISAAALLEAARGVAAGAEAVFLSCTALRTVAAIPALEAALARPVLSSNQATAWHLARPV